MEISLGLHFINKLKKERNLLWDTFSCHWGGGADTSIVTASANDVIKGKVIVGPDGEPITGTIEKVNGVSIEYNGLSKIIINSKDKLYTSNITILAANSNIFRKYFHYLPSGSDLGVEITADSSGLTVIPNQSWAGNYLEKIITFEDKESTNCIDPSLLTLSYNASHHTTSGIRVDFGGDVKNSSRLYNAKTELLYIKNSYFTLVLKLHHMGTALYMSFRRFEPETDLDEGYVTIELAGITCYVRNG